MFYGILVAIMFEANERHHLPHFHVRYQNFKASIAIVTRWGQVLFYRIPIRHLRAGGNDDLTVRGKLAF